MASTSLIAPTDPNGPGMNGNGEVNGGPLVKRDFVELHELAKGWKAAIARATDPSTRIEAQRKNDRGNLPLHSAASFRAPLEVAEALLEAYPEAASMTNNYGNLALHFTAWKKGPLEVEKLLLRMYPQGAAQKNNHGNLPLHYAAHYNAPLEVVEALYQAYPEAAHQKNNDNNTPLDLAIADGASPNVVALLQGKSVPPTDDEVFEGAKGKVERMEKELQRNMENHDVIQEDLEAVLSLLMDVRDGHPHALFSTGVDPTHVTDLDTLLEQVRKAGEEDRIKALSAAAGVERGADGDVLSGEGPLDEDDEIQLIEDALIPPDDEVEQILSKIVGCDAMKNQIRGLRRTLEMSKAADLGGGVGPTEEPPLPRHMALVGNPGCGMERVARFLIQVLHKIGAVPTENYVEAGRDELVDRRSEEHTIAKTRAVLERASGGVLFLDEPYTLLPSNGRPAGRDHGASALTEVAGILPTGNPLVILTGNAAELQRMLASDMLGYKGHFLLRVEFADPTTLEIARLFLSQVSSKGYVPGEGVTVEHVAQLLESSTGAEWRSERNFRIADLMVYSVRSQIRRRMLASGESNSQKSSSPTKSAPKIPVSGADEITVTMEDIQNVVESGF